MVPNTDHPAWKRIKAMYDRGDIDRLDRMLRRDEAYEAMGKIGKLVQTTVLWFISMAVALYGVKSWIDQYIQSKGG